MAKLGYTWYPKDWGNSESVFELNLSERGLYRELIDLAMLNDNKTEVKKEVWSRKFGVSNQEITDILIRLVSLKLVEIIDNILFIPSCESRLNLSRGGKKSKPTSEAISNLKNQKSEPISEPISEQIEKKYKVNIKEKEIENKNKPFDFFVSLFSVSQNKKLVDEWLKVRKSKKLTNTETALNGFLKQVEKSGYTVNEVLQKCVEKSWGGFESDWFNKKTSQNQNRNPAHSKIIS